MAINTDIAAITGQDIPALKTRWQTWAYAQIEAAKAAKAQDLQDLHAQDLQALQAELDTTKAALAQAQQDLAQAVADHDEEVATLKAAIGDAGPPSDPG